MDFIKVPFFYDYYVILYRLPTASETKWQIVTKPFKSLVWVVLALSVPFVSVIVSLITRCSSVHVHHRQQPLTGLASFMASFWYCFGAVLTQGTNVLILCFQYAI